MLIPTTVAVFATLLSSAIAGPHARLKSPKIRPKKTGLMEVLAASSSSNPTFNPVTVAPKTNIFNSLTDDEAVGLFFPHHSPADI
jgi:hypothetical protein